MLSSQSLALLLWCGAVGWLALAPQVPDDFAVRWTIRFALAAWFCAVGLHLFGRTRYATRWLWLAGAVAFVAHVVAAFDRVHQWSHAAAFQRTLRDSGLGEGIYVSYGFGLVWLVDALWTLARAEALRQASRWRPALHLFMAFIIFNGTIIYETGPIRWAGAIAFAILAGLVGWRWQSRAFTLTNPAEALPPLPSASATQD